MCFLPRFGEDSTREGGVKDVYKKWPMTGSVFAITLCGIPSSRFACEEKCATARTTSGYVTLLKVKPSSLAVDIIACKSSSHSELETETLAKCEFSSSEEKPWSSSRARACGMRPRLLSSLQISFPLSRASNILFWIKISRASFERCSARRARDWDSSRISWLRVRRYLRRKASRLSYSSLSSASIFFSAEILWQELLYANR